MPDVLGCPDHAARCSAGRCGPGKIQKRRPGAARHRRRPCHAVVDVPPVRRDQRCWSGHLAPDRARIDMGVDRGTWGHWLRPVGGRPGAWGAAPHAYALTPAGLPRAAPRRPRRARRGAGFRRRGRPLVRHPRHVLRHHGRSGVADDGAAGLHQGRGRSALARRERQRPGHGRGLRDRRAAPACAPSWRSRSPRSTPTRPPA